MGLSSGPFGNEDLPNEGIHEGTYTSTRPLPFSSPCAKEDGPAWPCDDVAAGTKMRRRGLMSCEQRHVPDRYSRATSFTRLKLY